MTRQASNSRGIECRIAVNTASTMGIYLTQYSSTAPSANAFSIDARLL